MNYKVYIDEVVLSKSHSVIHVGLCPSRFLCNCEGSVTVPQVPQNAHFKIFGKDATTNSGPRK